MKRIIIFILSLFALSFIMIGCSKKNVISNEAGNMDSTEMIALLDEYKPTLDGAFAEKYANDLYVAYQDSDTISFIKQLSNYDLITIDHIIKMLVGETVINDRKYAEKEFTTVYDTLHDDKDLSEIEIYIIYDIYTWLLYYQISLK